MSVSYILLFYGLLGTGESPASFGREESGGAALHTPTFFVGVNLFKEVNAYAH